MLSDHPLLETEAATFRLQLVRYTQRSRPIESTRCRSRGPCCPNRRARRATVSPRPDSRSHPLLHVPCVLHMPSRCCLVVEPYASAMNRTRDRSSSRTTSPPPPSRRAVAFRPEQDLREKLLRHERAQADLAPFQEASGRRSTAGRVAGCRTTAAWCLGQIKKKNRIKK